MAHRLDPQEPCVGEILHHPFTICHNGKNDNSLNLMSCMVRLLSGELLSACYLPFATHRGFEALTRPRMTGF